MAEEKQASQDTIARRIQGLLALAEDAAKQGNESLCNNYIEKAAALQLKYAVDAAMLQKAKPEQSETIGTKDFCRESNTPLIKAKRTLINVVARFNRGSAFIFGEYQKDKADRPKLNKRAGVRVYAHESDLAFIEMLYTSLLLQMQSMMANDEHHEQLMRGKVTQAWRVSYAHGWVERVYHRLSEIARRQEREAEATTPGTALVLRDRQAEVERHVAANHAIKAARIPTSDKNPAGRSAGYTAAGNADLGQKAVRS